VADLHGEGTVFELPGVFEVERFAVTIEGE
jgi:hypothetical protein